MSILWVGCGSSDNGSASEPVGEVVDAGARRNDASTSDASTRDASKPDASTVTPSEDCNDASKLVYVLGEDGMLSSFRPDTLVFTDIGRVNCEGSTPNSMSVDRRGVAWVAYQSGAMYQVSTSDASCKPIARTPGEAGFETFGMGFVAVDGKDDQLFIADLGSGLSTSSSRLGVIDPESLATSSLGALDGTGAELTGTGDGKLWAFYAQDSQRSLARLDTSSGATLESHTLSTINSLGTQAWAVAFWGGDFFVFLRGLLDPSTTVYRVNGETFEQTVAIKSSGRTIVGAGVSTCAPLVFVF